MDSTTVAFHPLNPGFSRASSLTEELPNARRILLPCRHYDLEVTLNSGQAFRWTLRHGAWDGVIGNQWVRLRQHPEGILAECADGSSVPKRVAAYLQCDLDLDAVLATFPADEPMRQAVEACRGLRLLRQDPWECLAGFICSSTKRIAQIRQIMAEVCRRYGEPVEAPAECGVQYAFPAPERIARITEAALRRCKMGFRAPYVLSAARAVVDGDCDLDAIREAGIEEARMRLMGLPGVGRKIADCVLLFAYGYQEAFPVDVWVEKALRRLYFRDRPVPRRKLLEFASGHFGPFGGFAQQYLFHYMRVGPRHGSPEAKAAA